MDQHEINWICSVFEKPTDNEQGIDVLEGNENYVGSDMQPENWSTDMEQSNIESLPGGIGRGVLMIDIIN